jgi:hypothetical protein
MKRFLIIVAFCFVFFAMAIPCFGQIAKGCNLSGTWYGGSDLAYPYKFTAAPIDGSRYTVTFWNADIANPNYNTWLWGWTDWTGVAIKGGPGQKINVYAVALYQLSPNVYPGMSPDMDVLHSTIEFTPDCNTIRHTIDTFYGYLPWTKDKVPFFTEPDDNYLQDLGVQTLVETYFRMPTTCPNCPFTGAAKSVLGPAMEKLRGKQK